MRFIRQALAIAILMFGCGTRMFAADIARLHNGFTIRHEHRIAIGESMRLFLTKDKSSFVDVPTSAIDGYEHDDSPPPIPTTPAANSLTPAANSLAAPSAITAVSIPEAVASASGRYRLDPDLVNSVIRAESGFNPKAVSRKGAQGLMQLMPETASNLGVTNRLNPQENVEGGTRYLRELLERYNFDLIKALAAYNAGPHRVEQYGGVPPYAETRAYVRRIVNDFNRKKTAQSKQTAPTRSGAPSSPRNPPVAKPADGKAPLLATQTNATSKSASGKTP